MKAEDLPYRSIGNCTLFNLLRDSDISGALSYMLTGKVYNDLNVTAHDFSIELSNSSITISVVLYVGFEQNEYLKMKERQNYCLVSFNSSSHEINEFEGLGIRYIDNVALMNYCVSLSANDFAQKMSDLKNLNI